MAQAVTAGAEHTIIHGHVGDASKAHHPVTETDDAQAGAVNPAIAVPPEVNDAHIQNMILSLLLSRNTSEL